MSAEKCLEREIAIREEGIKALIGGDLFYKKVYGMLLVITATILLAVSFVGNPIIGLPIIGVDLTLINSMIKSHIETHIQLDCFKKEIEHLKSINLDELSEKNESADDRKRQLKDMVEMITPLRVNNAMNSSTSRKLGALIAISAIVSSVIGGAAVGIPSLLAIGKMFYNVSTIKKFRQCLNLMVEFDILHAEDQVLSAMSLERDDSEDDNDCNVKDEKDVITEGLEKEYDPKMVEAVDHYIEKLDSHGENGIYKQKQNKI